MRHRVAGRKLGRTTSHRQALMRNLSSALFEKERITTTLAKAKELRPFAERLGRTLLHFVWQGGIAAVLLGGVLVLLRRRAGRPGCAFTVEALELGVMDLRTVGAGGLERRLAHRHGLVERDDRVRPVVPDAGEGMGRADAARFAVA